MAVRDPRDDYPPRMGRNGGRVGRRAYPAHDSTLVTASTHFFDRVPLGDSAIDFFDPRAVSPNELPANDVGPNQTAVEVGPVDQRRGVAGDATQQAPRRAITRQPAADQVDCVYGHFAVAVDSDNAS